MDAEMIALATAGSTAFMTAAGGDLWEQFKGGIAKVLGRGKDQRVASAELELARTQILVAAESAEEPGEAGGSAAVPGAVTPPAEQIRLAWQARLLEVFAQDETAVDDVRELVHAFRAAAEEQKAGGITVINNTMNDGSHDIAIQAGNIGKVASFRVGTPGDTNRPSGASA
ncbi:hypothetical protein [Streptacidiphilus fuscans]|uniref:Uncharacterized protein n=1 Tax=Streptacidiphilus fuscans TaxID=2789292 RepID=A0A931BAJ2_9ACTN|nr:hypothetical protein [Streptacidiphilus fuscans]MBF9073061.1 hypothetical protein [Streptacidiphilus fuscans]